MSLIIDANRASDFARPVKYHAPEILKRVAAKKVKIVAGGQLLDELARTALRELLVEWQRAGVVQNVSADQVETQSAKVSQDCKSNDHHVVALAIEGGARLLYSDDAELIADFKNVALISPKGKAMQTTTRPDIVRALLDQFGT